MAQRRDDILGRIAVERGFLTDQQLSEARAVQQKALTDLKLEQGLGTILVSRKLLSSDELRALSNQVAIETGEARRIGRYELVSRLGAGGMGAVYRAKATDTGESVAIKILQPALTKPEYVKRFEREAKLASQLDHPNIVRFIEVGHDKKRGLHYCALELIEGMDLGKFVEEHSRVEQRAAAKITRQIAAALAHAHERGLVHRDIKPENIMITNDGSAKLLDLGLARPIHEEVTRLTESGVFVGSPCYASPEQASTSRDLDVRSDIYSLGATLFYMVTGRPPFYGRGVLAVLQAHLYEQIPWPADINPQIEDALCYIIARMMAKKPEDRYQTPAELAADLDAFASRTEITASAASLGRSTVAPAGEIPVAGAGEDGSEALRTKKLLQPTTAASTGLESDSSRLPRHLVPIAASVAGALLTAIIVAAVMSSGGPEDTEDTTDTEAEPALETPAVPPDDTPSAPTDTADVAATAKEPSYVPPVEGKLAEGLTGYWMFDDASGTLAANSAAEGKFARLRGGTWTRGRYGGGILLEGAGQSLEGDGDGLIATPIFSLSAWVRPTVPFGEMTDLDAIVRIGDMLVWGCPQERTESLGIDSRLLINGSLHARCEVLELVPGEWAHIAVVSTGGEAALFFNGRRAVSSPVDIESPRAPTGRLTLGRGLRGVLDEVRIYARALSDADVKTLALAAPVRAEPLIPSLPSGRAYPGSLYRMLPVVWGHPRPRVELGGTPAWLVAKEEGAATGTPGAGDSALPQTITIRATNEVGVAVRQFELTVVQPTLETGMLARWQFDNRDDLAAGAVPTAGDAARISGGSRVVGKSGGALWLDGQDDFIQAPVLGLGPSAPRSICAWVKAGTNVFGSGANVIGFVPRTGGRQDGFRVCVGSDGSIRIDYGDGATGARLPGGWHHICATYRGGQGDATFYLDGKLIVSRKLSVGIPDRFFIGRPPGEKALNGFMGSVDEVRVYERALAAGEVRELAGQ